MITPSEFLEHRDYDVDDFKSITDAKHILKALNCDDLCKDVIEKNNYLKCSADTINSDACRRKSRSEKEWPAIEHVNALKTALTIYQNRKKRIDAADRNAKRNAERKEEQIFKLYQHVTLQNMKSEKYNGMSAWIIRMEGEYFYVITSPNEGSPIKVKKEKCRSEKWKDFDFQPIKSLQAYPKYTPFSSTAPPFYQTTPIPAGLKVEMNMTSERMYNLYSLPS